MGMQTGESESGRGDEGESKFILVVLLILLNLIFEIDYYVLLCSWIS